MSIANDMHVLYMCVNYKVVYVTAHCICLCSPYNDMSSEF